MIVNTGASVLEAVRLVSSKVVTFVILIVILIVLEAPVKIKGANAGEEKVASKLSVPLIS